MSNGYDRKSVIRKINKNIGDYEDFSKIAYYLGYLHLGFLYVIHLPIFVLEKIHLGEVQRYYVGWGPRAIIFLYFAMGIIFRHFYTLNQTMHKEDMYRKSVFFIFLGGCTSFWLTTLMIPEELGGGEAKGVFKFLLFFGFLLMSPITIPARSSIIIPFLVGYKVMNKLIKPQRKDPEIDHQAWNYVLTGKDVLPVLEEEDQKYYTPLLDAH